MSNFPHFELPPDVRHFYPANTVYHPVPYHSNPPSENGTLRSKSAVAINQISRPGEALFARSQSYDFLIYSYNSSVVVG
jgi:hypothetical protein